MTERARAASATVLVLLYPYLVYRGIQAGTVWLAPSLMIAYLGYQAFVEPRPSIKVKKGAMALMLAVGILFFQTFIAKMLPTLIQLLLMVFFGKTLRQGPPLIERFVRLDFPELSPDLIHYARQLTILWTCFFAANALICTILAVFAPASWWAIYTGVMLLALTTLLMAGEYIYRHYRFPHLEIPDIKTTIYRMVLNSRQIWRDLYAA
jgi:uncharacterized membrane protein